MNPQDVKQLIHSELEAFSYEPPPREGVLGVPWSKEHMAAEVVELRRSLVDPELVPVTLADDPQARSTRMLWVVTRPDSNGYVLVFDPDGLRFGLAAIGANGPPETVAVWGDLVTTYAAR